MQPQLEKKSGVHLFTDGACKGNPGPGGWAFVLKHPATNRYKEDSGGEHGTTNNRMEMMAVIHGLEAIRGSRQITLFSDSQYLLNGIGQWMHKWKLLGWKRTANAKTQVKNADLWQRLYELAQQHQLTTSWVRGHDGHRENERCDHLATEAAAKIAATPVPAQAMVLPMAKEITGLLRSDALTDEESS